MIKMSLDKSTQGLQKRAFCVSSFLIFAQKPRAISCLGLKSIAAAWSVSGCGRTFWRLRRQIDFKIDLSILIDFCRLLGGKNRKCKISDFAENWPFGLNSQGKIWDFARKNLYRDFCSILVGKLRRLGGFWGKISDFARQKSDDFWRRSAESSSPQLWSSGPAGQVLSCRAKLDS